MEKRKEKIVTEDLERVSRMLAELTREVEQCNDDIEALTELQGRVLDETIIRLALILMWVESGALRGIGGPDVSMTKQVIEAAALTLCAKGGEGDDTTIFGQQYKKGYG